MSAGVPNPATLELFFRLADGIIIGSAYKTGGHFLDPVDPQKAQAVMQAARQAREVNRGIKYQKLKSESSTA